MIVRRRPDLPRERCWRGIWALLRKGRAGILDSNPHEFSRPVSILLVLLIHYIVCSEDAQTSSLVQGVGGAGQRGNATSASKRVAREQA